MPSENTIAEQIRALNIGNPDDLIPAALNLRYRTLEDAARIAEAGEAKLREELEAAKAKIAALQADPDYTTVYMAGVADGKDAVAKELESLRAKLARAREGLEKIAAGAPTEKPERYDGDNHGDSVSYGFEAQHFCDAEIARAFLKETQ